MQLQSKGFIKIHYDLVVVGNLVKVGESYWVILLGSPIAGWFLVKPISTVPQVANLQEIFSAFSARKTQKKRGRKLLLGSKVSEDRQLSPQFVILVVRLSKENNNNQDQQGIKARMFHPSEVMPCQSWPDFIRTSRKSVCI